MWLACLKHWVQPLAPKKEKEMNTQRLRESCIFMDYSAEICLEDQSIWSDGTLLRGTQYRLLVQVFKSFLFTLSLRV